MSLLPRKMRIKANATNAGRIAKNARSVARVIDEDMRESLRNVGSDAELIYQSVAPRRSHRLARGIRAVPVGDEVVVSATAVDPDSGYDYVAVTRFGHRKSVIRPVTRSGQPRKSRTVTRGLGGQFRRRGAGALAFFSRGSHWLLPSVRGFKPKGDWVDIATPDIKAAADTELDQTANRIAVRWKS